MKRSRFNETEIISVLQQTEITSVAEVAFRFGITPQTIYNWRQKYARRTIDDVDFIRRLEQENARLRKALGARNLEVETMKDIISRVISLHIRRQEIIYAQEQGISLRRACDLLRVARSTFGYPLVRASSGRASPSALSDRDSPAALKMGTALPEATTPLA